MNKYDYYHYNHFWMIGKSTLIKKMIILLLSLEKMQLYWNYLTIDIKYGKNMNVHVFQNSLASIARSKVHVQETSKDRE